jgi:hypothetical protein
LITYIFITTREEPMVQTHSRTPQDYTQWVSTLLAHTGSYGVVTLLSQQVGVARQTLYRWKAKGQTALEAAFTPAGQGADGGCPLERAILTLFVEGHASYRGIQQCLWALLGQQVSLGTISSVIQTAGKLAQQWMSQHAPASMRVLALDELYGRTHGQAYLTVVDVHSGAVWASASPVEVDAESWTLVLWQVQEQGIEWQTSVSDGGRAIGEAVATVAPERPHQRDVWHVLHSCQQAQARLDRVVGRLEQQVPVVARQAARLAAGKGLRGKNPKSDVEAHAAQLAQARYVAQSLAYLSSELHRLLEVVVLADSSAHGVMQSSVRQGELETLLILLEELSQAAPADMQHELTKVVTLLEAALPHLVLFAPALDALQDDTCQLLGAEALRLLAWAWQRRVVLGPSSQNLLQGLPPDWLPIAEPVLMAWDHAVRASSAVENWHSVLRPYLAVHRRLSTGMLALLAVWHNHRVAQRGLHQGQSPLMRSGMTTVARDWLVALGYPPRAPALLPAPAAQPEPVLALAA